MTRLSNPFLPRFGYLPPVMGGRDHLLQSLSRAQENLNAPEGVTLLTGPRGMGKTAMLRAAAKEASARGWYVISVSTADGPLPAVVAAAASRAMPEPTNQWRIDRVRAGIPPHIDVSRTTPTTQSSPHVRYLLLDLAERAQAERVGLLLMVDELHAVGVPEARELASAIQHVASGDLKPLAFIGSGLPQMNDTILQDEGMTFFRRSHRADIGVISRTETRRVIAETITGAGGSIHPEALEMATRSASGYPFQIQLLGFHAWERCEDPASGISGEDIEHARGIADAHPESRLVSSPLTSLTDTARRFLSAMEAHRATPISHIIRTMATSGQNANYYRRRLIDQGLIRSAGRGKVEHAHPEARYWLPPDIALPPGDPLGEGPSNSKSSLKSQIVGNLKRNQELSYARIARSLNTSRAYVRNIAVQEDLERNSRGPDSDGIPNRR